LPTEATFSGAEPKLRKKTPKGSIGYRAQNADFRVSNRETEKTPAKKTGEPRIAKAVPNLQASFPNAAARGERSHKLDEAELKERARAIEEKCLEFDISGTRDANQSRSGGHHVRIQAGSRNQITRASLG